MNMVANRVTHARQTHPMSEVYVPRWYQWHHVTPGDVPEPAHLAQSVDEPEHRRSDKPPWSRSAVVLVDDIPARHHTCRYQPGHLCNRPAEGMAGDVQRACVFDVVAKAPDYPDGRDQVAEVNYTSPAILSGERWQRWRRLLPLSCCRRVA